MEIIQEILGYANLAGKWGGEGYVAPTSEVINDAIQMLNVLPPEIGVPKSSILADGEIAIYWEKGDTYAEIVFSSDNKYYSYGTAPGIDTVYLDDMDTYVNNKCEFPEKLLEILTHKFSVI